MAVIHLDEPARREAPGPSFALFALGFRPFYLLAAALAVLVVPVWVEVLAGTISLTPAVPVMLWHGHEMVFGFAVAVITGFLFTAVRNWTGLQTPAGWPLAALAALWLAGRLAMLCAGTTLAAVVDLGFLPVVMWAIGRVLVRARNRRNYFVPVVLGALWCADTAFHLSVLDVIGLSPVTILHAAVAVVIVLETVMAGRVVPLFTATALGVQPWRHPRLDHAAVTATALSLACWVALPAGIGTSVIAALAIVLQGVRCTGWLPWKTLGRPILWILHLSHAWIPVALLLLALAPMWAPAGAAVLHVLTVGSTAGLILGMITRTALGHTGRPLVAGRTEQWMYALVIVALAARVLPVLLAGTPYVVSLRVAAAAWTLAFGLYLWRYTPILWFSRVDGKPG